MTAVSTETPIHLKTLADFKRFLARPGATVQLIRHDWATSGLAPAYATKPHLWEPRSVGKLQTNAVGFKTPGRKELSWLEFGTAARYRFNGAEVMVNLRDDDDSDFAEVMIYRCTIDERALAPT